jgi:protein TonB
MIVEVFNTALARFFALSIALHILAFVIVRPQPLIPTPTRESIAVSLLPQAEPEPARPSRIPKAAPAAKISKPPGVIARRDSGMAKATPAPSRETPAPAEQRREEPPARPTIEEKTVVAERPLPSVKDLLPSATWLSSSERGSAPVSLNTNDPLYVSYFTRIKQSIEQQWEYPELALRYGLQGRLSLVFTIGATGQLEQLRIIRSSGSELLDQEALRAIKAAAPFPAIPTWIKLNPLSISASMEYHDNRLNYRYTR